jgi:hypothetical protein
MLPQIIIYNQILDQPYQEICNQIAQVIDTQLQEATCKIWHAHPVWFLQDNPIVGYSKQKKGIRLMFWSGADFNEPALNIKGAKFKDASVFYNFEHEIDAESLKRWLKKGSDIQWDYKNIVKRKGILLKMNN